MTLNVPYRPSVINDHLIQSLSSVFVTWSSLNKSYVRNYTLPLDPISLRKQALPQPLSNFQSLSLRGGHHCSCPFHCSPCLPVHFSTTVTSLPFSLSSLFASLISNYLLTCFFFFQLYFLLLSVTSSVSLFLYLSCCHTSCHRSPPLPVSFSW